MQLGKLKLFSLSDGYFGLDGGAMFGVVPRIFWQRTNPPDERNRIRLALRPLLIEATEGLIMIDTGIGDKQGEKFREIYRVEHSSRLLDTLQAAGYSAGEISHVINTHLHFDHCGGNTRHDDAGQVVPTFPNATYYVQQNEWLLATKPDRRSQASYLPENFQPVETAEQLMLLNGDTEVIPGVKVIHTGGHTGGHQIVIVESEGKRAVYWGDLVPTASHLSIPYVMGYDTMPLVTMEQKERLLDRALREEWLMFFEHDPEICCGYLHEHNGKYTVERTDA